MKKFIILSIVFMFVAITPLMAQSYLGGEWNYGSDMFTVWSNYYHASVSHYAAIDEQGGPNVCTDDSAGPGYSARAKQNQNPLTDQIARAGHGTTYCK